MRPANDESVELLRSLREMCYSDTSIVHSGPAGYKLPFHLQGLGQVSRPGFPRAQIDSASIQNSPAGPPRPWERHFSAHREHLMPHQGSLSLNLGGAVAWEAVSARRWKDDEGPAAAGSAWQDEAGGWDCAWLGRYLMDMCCVTKERMSYLPNLCISLQREFPLLFAFTY